MPSQVIQVLLHSPNKFQIDEPLNAEKLRADFFQLVTAIQKENDEIQGDVGTGINLHYGEIIAYLRDEHDKYCTYGEAVELFGQDTEMHQPWLDQFQDIRTDYFAFEAGYRLFTYWTVAVAFGDIELADLFAREISTFALKAKTPRFPHFHYDVFDSRPPDTHCEPIESEGEPSGELYWIPIDKDGEYHLELSIEGSAPKTPEEHEGRVLGELEAAAEQLDEENYPGAALRAAKEIIPIDQIQWIAVDEGIEFLIESLRDLDNFQLQAAVRQCDRGSFDPEWQEAAKELPFEERLLGLFY